MGECMTQKGTISCSMLGSIEALLTFHYKLSIALFAIRRSLRVATNWVLKRDQFCNLIGFELSGKRSSVHSSIINIIAMNDARNNGSHLAYTGSARANYKLLNM